MFVLLIVVDEPDNERHSVDHAPSKQQERRRVEPREAATLGVDGGRPDEKDDGPGRKADHELRRPDVLREEWLEGVLLVLRVQVVRLELLSEVGGAPDSSQNQRTEHKAGEARERMPHGGKDTPYIWGQPHKIMTGA